MTTINTAIKANLLSEIETGKELKFSFDEAKQFTTPSFNMTDVSNAMQTASAEMLEERYRLEDEEDMTDEEEIKTALINYVNSKY